MSTDSPAIPDREEAHGLGPYARTINDAPDGFKPVTYLIAGNIYLQQGEGLILLSPRMAADLVAALTPKPEDRASDMVRMREAAQFLSDRLDDLEWLEGDLEATLRDFMGHVDPAHARLKSALAALHPGEPE